MPEPSDEPSGDASRSQAAEDELADNHGLVRQVAPHCGSEQPQRKPTLDQDLVYGWERYAKAR